MWYTIPLLIRATNVLADYFIDNANASIVYSKKPNDSGGVGWQTWSISTPEEPLSISNLTGNYTIPLDPSLCYDQNYASSGACSTDDNCFVQIPFVGSGIAIYLFNAGFSGMAGNFSVDGGTGVYKDIGAPPAPTFQAPRAFIHFVQDLPTGNHTMTVTLLDRNNKPSLMRFDYAHVNETYIGDPANTSSTSSMILTSTSTSFTSSQMPSQTSAGNSATSHSVSIGDGVGAALGGFVLLSILVIGFLYLRRRKLKPAPAPTPESTLQINLFPSEPSSTPTSISYVPDRSLSFESQGTNHSVSPRMRSATLYDASIAANQPLDSTADQSVQSVRSRQGPVQAVVQSLHQQPSHNVDVDIHARSSAFHGPDADSPFGGPDMASRYNLTANQVGVVDQLRVSNVHLETIARVIEGYVSTNLSSGEANGKKLNRVRSAASAAPPRSYQTDV